VKQNVAASPQNVAFSALLFLYRDVLHIELPAIEHVERVLVGTGADLELADERHR